MSILFSDLGLNPILLDAVNELGYTEPTPVQIKVIPHSLAGNDLMVSSQTGSGKTAAFLLPILNQIIDQPSQREFEQKDKGRQRTSKMAAPRALVLCPTRELAQQVAKDAIKLKGKQRNLRIATVVGGMPYNQQIRDLQDVTILVATPGRLIDLYERRAISFQNVTFFVADEADRMLDLGFAEDLAQIHNYCKNNQQTVMFSATFPKSVMQLAESMMEHPIKIELSTTESINTNIDQRLNWADNLEHQDKILMHWLANDDLNQAVVFTSTQIESEQIAEHLIDQGFSASCLHGGIPQKTRNRRLESLRNGRTQILVATDVAARGIDVSTITHVINYGLPMKPEDYVHRIGRTGRAGRSGTAITIAHPRDRRKLDAIVRYTSNPIESSVIPGLEPQLKLSSFSDRPSGGKRRKGRGSAASSTKGRAFSSKPRRESAGNFFEGKTQVDSSRIETRSAANSAAPKKAFGDRDRSRFSDSRAPREQGSSDRSQRRSSEKTYQSLSKGGKSYGRSQSNAAPKRTAMAAGR